MEAGAAAADLAAVRARFAMDARKFSHLVVDARSLLLFHSSDPSSSSSIFLSRMRPLLPCWQCRKRSLFPYTTP